MAEHSDPIFLVDESGAPTGMIDVDKLQTDAALMAFEFAAAANDPAAIDRIGREWSERLTSLYAGGVVCGALALLTRDILDPLIMVLEELQPDVPFRAKLAEHRDQLARLAGGGR